MVNQSGLLVANNDGLGSRVRNVPFFTTAETHVAGFYDKVAVISCIWLHFHDNSHSQHSQQRSINIHNVMFGLRQALHYVCLNLGVKGRCTYMFL